VILWIEEFLILKPAKLRKEIMGAALSKKMEENYSDNAKHV